MSSHHLILGGQRSGKSRYAEHLGRQWLAQEAGREVMVVATAMAADGEMQQRIERHRRDRPSGFATLEEPLDLGGAIVRASQPGRLLIVDCLTLWVTNVLMPHGQEPVGDWRARKDALLSALDPCRSPVILVSNEIGQGVIPMGAVLRQFVDELGWLHQDVSRRCARLTWMVAGQPFTKEVEAW